MVYRTVTNVCIFVYIFYNLRRADHLFIADSLEAKVLRDSTAGFRDCLQFDVERNSFTVDAVG